MRWRCCSCRLVLAIRYLFTPTLLRIAVVQGPEQRILRLALRERQHVHLSRQGAFITKCYPLSSNLGPRRRCQTTESGHNQSSLPGARRRLASGVRLIRASVK